MTATKLGVVARFHVDQVLAVVMAALFATEVLLGVGLGGREPWGALVAAMSAGSLALRRTAPAVPVLAAVVVIQLSHTTLPGIADTGSFLVVILVAIYSAGAHAQRRTLVLTAAIVMVVIPLAALDPRQPPGFGDWVFFVVFLGAPFVAGLAFRRRRMRDTELAERALIAEREGLRLAASAVAAERLRIARELHDVVAHSISVIVVQSRGGRRTLPSGAGTAREAFDTIEEVGEQALVEMRRLLQVLRDDDSVGPGDLTPRPGLARLGDLVTHVRGTGLEADVVVEGVPDHVSPGVDLSAYRIIQEALTNVVKHAGQASVQVSVRYRPDQLEIEVTDDGDGSGSGGGSGHGLDGVRERVAIHGGSMHAGPRPGGGFSLRASLPLEVVR